MSGALEHLPSLTRNYELLRELGEGGMGHVWLARDRRLERLVAVKRLKVPEDQTSQKEFVARFQTEARAIARLSHPNIVSIYDFGEEAGHYYMIMEYLEGRPLSQLITDFPRIPLPLCLAVGVQICSALAYIHQRGIIHRDIKPANILLSREGVAKLTDFGIIKLTGPQRGLSQLETSQTSIGTIKYASPEQLLDASRVDHTTDIYALGLTLFELLTQEHPFEAPTVSEFISRVFEGNIPSVREIFWDIPEAVDQILAKALARNAEERFQSAAEMGQLLSELVDSKSLQRVLVGPLFNLKSSFPEHGHESPSLSTEPVGIVHTDLRLNPETRRQLKALRQDLSWVESLCLGLPVKEAERLPKARFLERVFSAGFSGIIQINQDTFALVQNGLFLDFISRSITPQLLKTGDDLFHIIPEQLEYIRLYLVTRQKQWLPLLIANVLNEQGQSSTENPLNLTHASLSEFVTQPDLTGYLMCKNANTFYCLGYAEGQQLFALELNQGHAALTEASFDQILARSHTLWDLYHAEVFFSPLNAQILLRQAILKPRFQDLDAFIEATLTEKLLPKAEQEAFEQGLQLDFSFHSKRQATIQILGQTLEVAEIITTSLQYQFLHFWFTELLLLIHKTAQGTSFQPLYQGLSDLGECHFFKTFPGIQEPFVLDICGFDRKKTEEILYAVKLMTGDELAIEKLVEELQNLQQHSTKFSSLQAVFLLAPGRFTSEALAVYTRLTKGQKSTADLRKGMICSDSGAGFQLCLVEYLQHEKRFNLVAPSPYG